MNKAIIYLAIIFILPSCLRTRSDIGFLRPGNQQVEPVKNQAYNPSGGYNDPVVTVPKVQTRSNYPANAPVPTAINQQDVARMHISLQEINDQIRGLHGRIEVLEKNVNDSKVQAGQVNIDSKLKNYEMALSNLEAQVQNLRTTGVPSGLRGSTSPDRSQVKLNAFGRGESLFREKKWRNAISEYQLYREQYPNGKDYDEATYKIGVCFQELNMKNEAKVFYQEAVSKFPSSKAGKKAKFRLKQL